MIFLIEHRLADHLEESFWLCSDLYSSYNLIAMEDMPETQILNGNLCLNIAGMCGAGILEFGISFSVTFVPYCG